MLLGIILTLLSNLVIAEEIIVYNSTNFTKPTNLVAPVNITSSNETQHLPVRKEETDKINITGKAQIMYQLPPEFQIPTGINLSIFENVSNNSSQIINNTNKSFMQKLDENPPLKYGLIIFLIVIIIIVAYIVYINYGGDGTQAITFDREFSPTGNI